MSLVKIFFKIFVTVVFISLFILILLSYLPKINKEYLEVVTKVIDDIHSNIIANKNDILENINLPENSLISLWIKREKENWVPIIILKSEKLYLNDKSTPFVPKELSYKIKEVRVVKNDSNIEYLAWINRLNYNFIIRKFLIIVLLLLIAYIALIILIDLFILPSSDFAIADEIGEHSFSSKKSLSNSELLEEYRELWNKNFKVSEEFKTRFNFLDIYKKMSFTCSIEEYIDFVLDIANRYFTKWESPAFYFFNNGKFINFKDNSSLSDIDNLKFASDSKARGDIFIPLFPYKIKNPLGYFKFTWTREEDFNIAEILYFLKFMFSYKIRVIFLSPKRVEKIKNLVNNALIKNKSLVVGFISVDKSEMLFSSLKDFDIENVNDKIKKLILSNLQKINLIQIDYFYYMFISKVENEFLANEIVNFISKESNQIFNIDRGKGTIAITYSASITDSSHRSIHAVSLIKEAEDKLKRAEENGGNMLF